MIDKVTGDSAWQMSKLLCKTKVQNKSQKTEIPPGDEWRVSYFEKLLIARLQAYYDGNEDEAERLTPLINSLAIN